MAHEAGKGSGRRPLQVPQRVADDNWDRIFGKKKEEKSNDKGTKRKD